MQATDKFTPFQIFLSGVAGCAAAIAISPLSPKPLAIASQLVGGFSGLGVLVSSQSPWKKVNDYRQRAQDLETRIAALTKESEELVERQSAEIEQERFRLAVELHDLKDEIKELHSIKDSIYRDIETAEREAELRRELAEMRHAQALAVERQEVEGQRAEYEGWVEEKRLELLAWREASEADLQRRAEELLSEKLSQVEQYATEVNSNWQQEKLQLLAEQEQEVQGLRSQLQQIAAQLVHAQERIDELEGPIWAEGYEEDKVASRAIQEILFKHGGFKTEYRRSWTDGGYINALLYIHEPNERKVRSFFGLMQQDMNLAECPVVTVEAGGFRFTVRPRSLMQLPPTSAERSDAPQLEALPEMPAPAPSMIAVNEEEAIALNEQLFFENYKPPQIKFRPIGEIKEAERLWVKWLWLYKSPPLRSQNEVMRIIWDAKAGNNNTYLKARERLHKILEEAGIDFQVRK